MSQTIVTPDDWASLEISTKGAVFNLAHGLDQMLWRRPQNKFEELDQASTLLEGELIQGADFLLFLKVVEYLLS